MARHDYANGESGKGSGHIIMFGTGDFAQALGWRLSKVGHRITFVSRNPEASRKKMMDQFADIVTAKDAMELSKELIILAIPETVDTKDLGQFFENQIVLDVRNKIKLRSSDKDYSLAQNLQEVHPNAQVVKSLNTLSAYALRSGIYQSGSQTALCGDDSTAKDKVSKVLRSLGLTPVDVGDIGQAIELENRPHAFFGEWKTAITIAAVAMSFFWIILVFRMCLCLNFDAEEWDFDRAKMIILTIAQLDFGLTALTALTLCYTPGVIAAYIQLFRGTKYSVFPNWLDTWMKSRKQLGLIAVQMALTHWIPAIIHIIPRLDPQSDWRHDAYFIAGTFGFCLMVILAAVSLPSVASSLSWKEFSFLQRYLGWWAFIFSVLHIVFVGWDTLIEDHFECIFIPHQLQIAIIIPALTILGKLPLLLPPIDNKLKIIRQGQDGKRTKNAMTVKYNVGEGVVNSGVSAD